MAGPCARRQEWKSRWAKACVLLILLLAALAVCLRGIGWAAPSRLLESHGAGWILLGGARVFLVLQTVLFIWRMVLFFRYRPHPAVADAELPQVTVIVPAYNEGRHVFDSLLSLLDSDFPREKLQIIAVDDGSRDDTWEWIRRAAHQAGGRIEAVKLSRNRGKREALVQGFHKATGDVFVTVDSDSIVESLTLRNLVAPIVHDARIGAVAGNVRVLNRPEGLIPRMLDVTFLYSFDFMRAGQSEVNTVTCTPGALSAYRSDVTRKVLEEWRAQTYCGRPAHIGEDRHMTNLILREGYHVTFQQNAVVWTNVPVLYQGLCKMFIRWARSNVRENLVMSTFLFRKFRQAPASGARINLLTFWMQMTVSQVFLVAALVLVCSHPSAFGMQTLLGISTASAGSAALYYWRTRSTDALFAFLYGFVWFFALSWINVYSLFTSHRSAWLTRDLPGKKPLASPNPPVALDRSAESGADFAAEGMDYVTRPRATEVLFLSPIDGESSAPDIRVGAL
jgi:hyaluronan synthase